MHSLQTRYMACLYYKHFVSSLRYVSRRFNVSKSSLHRWMHSKSFTKRSIRSKSTFLSEIDDAISNLVSKNPFLSLNQLSKALYTNLNLKRSSSSIHRSLKRSKITRKLVKTKFFNAKADNEYNFKQLHNTLNMSSSISVDESCFYFIDHPKYGYAKRGEKLTKSIPSSYLYPRKISLLLAIRSDCVIGWQLSDKPFNNESFAQFVKNKLCNLDKGTNVILDNVAFHKSKISRDAFNSVGLVPVFIPPYSPQFNPIEMVFSWLKRRLRHDIDRDFKLLKDNLTTILSSELEVCHKHSFANYFEHSRNALPNQQ